jgi:dihydrofolate reductase
MVIAALVLTDQNNAIGKNHIILNYLPGYVKYFQELTKGHPVIMGKRTFESIGHILKSKRNIVITDNEKYHSSRAKTHSSIHKALDACKKEKKVFVIGGSEIFKKSLPFTTEIYRTCLRARFKSDSYYPEISTKEFELKAAECINANEENKFEYCVERWERISNKQ